MKYPHEFLWFLSRSTWPAGAPEGERGWMGLGVPDVTERPRRQWGTSGRESSAAPNAFPRGAFGEGPGRRCLANCLLLVGGAE